MDIDGLNYDFVVTSANEFEYLSLECTMDDELLLAAELVSYPKGQATIHVYKDVLPLALVNEFTERVNQELSRGADQTLATPTPTPTPDAKKNSDTLLMLSAQRALLGAITPGLCAVSIERREERILWRCLFESESAKASQWGTLSLAATEVIADQPASNSIEEEYLVLPRGQGMAGDTFSASPLKHLVFLRRE